MKKTDCSRLKLRESRTDQEPAFAAMLAGMKYCLFQVDSLRLKGLSCRRASSMDSLI